MKFLRADAFLRITHGIRVELSKKIGVTCQIVKEEKPAAYGRFVQTVFTQTFLRSNSYISTIELLVSF